MSEDNLDDVPSMVMFAAVVDEGSFTGAAARLGLHKSVVSARVARLEERLGVRLLHRTTRRVAVTPAGASLYPACAEVARAAAEVRTRAHGDADTPRGRLRVNAPTVLGRWLAPVVASFLRDIPAVHVELTLQDHLVDPTAWDVVLRFGPVHDLDLVARRFATAPLVVIGSPDYLRRHGVPADPHALVRHACLRYANLPAAREWLFHIGDERVAIDVSGPATLADSGVLVQLAELGLGLAIAPWFAVVDAVKAGRLVTVLDDFPLGGLLGHAVHAHGSRPPARVRAFVEHLVAGFQPVPWEERISSAR